MSKRLLLPNGNFMTENQIRNLPMTAVFAHLKKLGITDDRDKEEFFSRRRRKSKGPQLSLYDPRKIYIFREEEKPKQSTSPKDNWQKIREEILRRKQQNSAPCPKGEVRCPTNTPNKGKCVPDPVGNKYNCYVPGF